MTKRIIFLFTLIIMFAVSCEEPAEKIENGSTVSSDKVAASDNAKIAPQPVALAFTCGDSLSGTYNTPNSLYTYPSQAIDVNCAATGATITIFYNAQQLPNRFTVKTAGGTTVASSGGWKGYASYGGPWGPSLSVPAAGSFTFTKAAGVSTYYLYVETLTPSGAITPNTDNWTVNASCTCVACTPTCPAGFICQNGSCVCTTNCIAPLGGTYSTINSLYTYPASVFTVPCNATGATVTVQYDAKNLPNRFTVKTPGGTVVGSSSGWKGYAPYGGPWGPSLSVPTTGSITFTKIAGQNTYHLIVETLTPVNTTFNPHIDTWSASVGCLPN